MSKDKTASAPAAKKIFNEITHFGDKRTDPYSWIRGKNPDDWKDVFKDPNVLDQEVRAHLEAENAYFNEHAKSFEPTSKAIETEMAGRIIPDDKSVAEKDGAYEYWSEFRSGGDYPTYKRREIATGVEELYYDGDKEAAGEDYFHIGDVSVSPNHQYFAYSTDNEGSEYFTIKVREISTGKTFTESIIQAADGVVWAKDSSKFYYVECDDNHRGKYVKSHVLGDDPKNDEIIFEEKDHMYFLYIDKTQSGEYITINSEGYKGTEVSVLSADALSRIIVSDYNGNEYELDFNDQAYDLIALNGLEFDTDILKIEYSSLSNPGAVYALDLKSGDKKKIKQKQLPNGHDPDDYIVERINVLSRDQKNEIPVTIVRHKDTAVDGSAPLYQYGYGCYGYSMPADFVTEAISLADRGGIYAIAHIRGGAERGEKWYKDGQLMNKKNTFFDFIDVTEGLTDLGYGQKGKVCIEGRSAGGLLMGAVTNLRPDLYAGVLAGVPFVDALNTMSDESLPLTPPEWEEIGDPITDEKMYHYMRSYSPYDNIKDDIDYPSVLATGGLTDPRVTYWEPVKWIARLRDEAKGGPFFVKTEMSAGHAGSKARYERVKERAPEIAFIVDCFENAGYDMSLKTKKKISPAPAPKCEL